MKLRARQLLTLTGLTAVEVIRQPICLLLTGYADDTDTMGEPTDIVTDDGKAGYGFRLHRRGRVYGPYGGSEDIPTADSDGRVFVDALDSPVLYYRYTTGTGFNDGDNNPDEPLDTSDYAPDSLNTFLLCTPGVDGEWHEIGDSGNDDDINNF